jgi:excisionase family DNA binding protein
MILHPAKRGSHMPKKYLTVRDAAKQLELTEYRVRQLINLKEIKATKIKQWRIKPGDLDAFIRARTNK